MTFFWDKGSSSMHGNIYEPSELLAFVFFLLYASGAQISYKSLQMLSCTLHPMYCTYSTLLPLSSLRLPMSHAGAALIVILREVVIACALGVSAMLTDRRSHQAFLVYFFDNNKNTCNTKASSAKHAYLSSCSCPCYM